MEPSPETGLSQAGLRLAGALGGNRGFDLVEAALIVAAGEYPDLDVSREVGRVRALAIAAARRVADLDNFFARMDGLRRFLYEERGFRGNLHDYKDPRNCFLNDVLDRRLGIPLSLSILHIEAARSAGFDARGVSLPGHFVVRLSREGRSLIVDPFHRGRVISPEDCRELVSVTTGRPWLYREELLEGTDDRSLIGRLLLNLKHVYVGRKEYERALGAVERLLLVRPDDPIEIRDRGLIRAELGQIGPAIADLESYLSVAPHAPDIVPIRGRIGWLRRKLAEAN